MVERKTPEFMSGFRVQRETDPSRGPKHQSPLSRKQSAVVVIVSGRSGILPFSPARGGVQRDDFVGSLRRLGPTAAGKKSALHAHGFVRRDLREERTALERRNEYRFPSRVKGWVLPVRCAGNARR